MDGSKTTIAQNAKGPYCRRLLYFFLLILRLRCPVSGVYPATWTAHAAPVLIHLFRCTAIIFAAAAAATATVAASVGVEECCKSPGHLKDGHMGFRERTACRTVSHQFKKFGHLGWENRPGEHCKSVVGACCCILLLVGS